MTGAPLPPQRAGSFFARLRERGVLRVAASYAVIAWLLLQIASVVFDPLGVPKWVMTALIIAAAVGFPIALGLAWFLEVGADGVHVDHSPAGVPRPQARGIRHYADAIVIGALLVAVVVLLVRQSDIARPKPPEHPAIAVLPFDNLSGDPGQDYFADGLAEELLDRLARVPGLRVVARSSSFSFRGAQVDTRTMAAKLGVSTLLEGSVRRSGRRLKLTARLIDGATGQQVWSGSFDREVTDIFSVQAELATAVVDAVIPAARGAVPQDAPPPTSDLGAYDLYLLARTQLLIRTPTSIRKSIELMEQAVQLDPNFARAHAQLGASKLFLRLMDDLPEDEKATLLREAEASIHRALSIDPDLPDAHGAYANLLRDTGRAGAEDEYKRALQLNPNNAIVWHDYAVYLGMSDARHDESDRATRRALELDPRQPVTWANYLSSTIAPGAATYRKELKRAIAVVGDMPFAIDRLTLPGAALMGFPIEILQAGIAKRRSDSGDNLPPWLNQCRAWSLVDDFDRAGRALAKVGGARHDVDFDVVRMFIEVELAGLRQDWPAFDQKIAALQSKRGADDPAIQSMLAFWQCMQGRCGEAAPALARSKKAWDGRGVPPLMNSAPDFGASEAMELRILRASGRAREADAQAAHLLESLRALRKKAGSHCMRGGDWVRYASLAANEGLRREAIDALEGALRCGEVPAGFRPWFPWFRSLEGDPGYDRQVAERTARIQRLRAEMAEIERQAGIATAEPLKDSSPSR